MPAGARFPRLWRLGPPAAAALLPKCGSCLMAHAGVLGALGVGRLADAAWLRPAVAVSLLLALALLFHGAPARWGYRPFALGCAAAALLAAELFHRHAPAHAHGAADPAAHPQLAVWSGVALLMAASLWNAWPRRACPGAAAAGGCPPCSSTIRPPAAENF